MEKQPHEDGADRGREATSSLMAQSSDSGGDNELSNLPEDLRRFVRSYLLCHGNLRTVEKALGISYSAVCEQLDRTNRLLLATAAAEARVALPDATLLTPAGRAIPQAIALATPADQQPIIDYAGPRPRQVTRLPARSDLNVHTAAGEVRVLETLSGKAAAIGAIAFALSTMAVMISIPLGPSAHDLYSGPVSARLSVMAAFPGAPLLAEAVVMALVINSTWRRTHLTVGDSGITLGMFTPFRRRIYQWSCPDLQDVLVTQTGTSAGGIMLGEFQMLLAGREVRLFTDHDYGTLAHLATNVRRLASPPASVTSP